MVTDVKTVDGVYPSGTAYKHVFVGEMEIGKLSCVDGGFKAINWRSTVAPIEVAIKKLRKEAVFNRQKEIQRLQREIEALET